MFVAHTTRQRVEAKLKECIAICEAKYARKFEMPTVEYTMSGRVAGTANGSKWHIQLSAPYLNDVKNVEEMIEETVPHEFAHLVTYRVYPESYQRGPMQFTSRGMKRGKREVHGPDWQSVMRVLGRRPDRLHTMELSQDLGQRERLRYDWLCTGCNKIIQLGPKHNKSQLLRGAVYHKGCRHAKLVKPGTVVVDPKPAVRPPQTIAELMKVIENSTLTVTDMTGAKPITRTYPPQAPQRTTQPTSKHYASKIDHCWDIYKTNVGLSRGTMISMFVSIASCTPAGAGTYYATCKKRHESGER